MSSATLTTSNSTLNDSTARFTGNPKSSEVVEIGLLLPAPWANALMELSKTRDQSVGQILRSIIGHALQDAC
jgi:hypothetical protein